MPKSLLPLPVTLSTKDKEDAIFKIKRLISKLNELNVEKIRERDDPIIEAMENKIEKLLVADIFSTTSIEYERYSSIAHLDTENMSIGSIPMDRIRKNLQQNKDY